MPAFFRKLLNLNASQNQIAAAVALGLILGFSPILSLQGLLVIVLMLVLSVPILTTVLSALLFSLVAFLLDPVANALGQAALEIEALRPVYTELYNMPLVPLTKFYNSMVMGGGILGLLLSPCVFFAVKILLVKYRKNPEAAQSKRRVRMHVAPTLIVLVALFIYFEFFFDHHVKKALEYFGTHANGAEVDVGDVRTSFLNASLEIDNVQVTDVEKPELNKIKIGNIKWKMAWDALLRAKVLVHEASILLIEISSPRAHAGYVLPKDPPSESQLEKISGQALDNAQKEFSGNIFGDIAGVLNGGDPKEQLKGMESNLKSEARIKELQAELGAKQKEWQERIKKLPQDKEIQDLQTRIKNVKPGNLNDPAKLQASIQQVAAIVQDASSKYKIIKETSDAFNNDFKKYSNMPKEIDGLVQSDLKDLEVKLKIPHLDADTIAKVLFGPSTLQKLKLAEFYMNKSRQYIPPKKSAAEKSKEKTEKLKPDQREKGKNYAFGKPHSYPLFWLQSAKLSSSANNSEFSGNLKGELKNLTNDQELTGEPTSLSFQGDFPKQQVFGINGLLSIDHRGDVPLESLDLKVQDLKLANKELLKSNDVQIGFQSADAESQFKIELSGQNVNLVSSNNLQKIEYNISAKQALLDDILKKAFKDISKIAVDAHVTGPWSALKFSIQTNVAKDLQTALQKQIQAKIGDVQGQLKSMIEGKIGGDKSKLMSQFTDEQNQIKSQLGVKQSEIDKAQKDISQGQNQAGGDQKKAVEKKLNDLKKQFGF